MISLLDLLQEFGITAKKAASTDGGEYAGPCPFCREGTDRFRVWPSQDRYWCRICAAKGDSIQFIRDTKGLSYIEACEYLKIEPKKNGLNTKVRSLPHGFTPKHYKPPTHLWQVNAQNFITDCERILWSEAGKFTRRWLYKHRGLNGTTIRQAHLGWNPSSRYMDRSAWGLPAETNENGKEKRIWLPQGLIIPHMVGGKIYRLRIRRPNPKHSSRYIVVSGSKMNPMSWDLDRKVFVAVESELDGLLLNQTVGDLVGILAMGSAQAKPDVIAYEALSRSDLILVALDYDDAGAIAFKRFWAKTYPQTKRWPVPEGKDPGDAFFAGVDLRTWISIGLENRKAGARL